MMATNRLVRVLVSANMQVSKLTLVMCMKAIFVIGGQNTQNNLQSHHFGPHHSVQQHAKVVEPETCPAAWRCHSGAPAITAAGDYQPDRQCAEICTQGECVRAG